jgi:hypothetical protein
MKRAITMSYVTATARKPLHIALDSSHARNGAVAGRATSSSRAIDNPLWIIVIAMACFFGVASLVIAAG